MRISFLQYCPFSPAPLLVSSSLIEKVSCYKLLVVHLWDKLTWNEHVTHIVKKGSKRLYIIRALKKCGLTDRQLILVYCSIIRSVLEYTSPTWAGLTRHLSDHIESVQKRALKIIFPSLSYEDAHKKSGLILLRQRREDACITFLKRTYSSSDLLRKLKPRVVFTRPHAFIRWPTTVMAKSFYSRQNQFHHGKINFIMGCCTIHKLRVLGQPRLNSTLRSSSDHSDRSMRLQRQNKMLVSVL